MDRVDEIVAELLRDTNALGVWLLGAIVIADNQQHNEVIAFAVADPSIKPPMKVLIESETYFDFVRTQLFAEPIGRAALVFVFDDRSSLGLVRLRIHHARDAIKTKHHSSPGREGCARFSRFVRTSTSWRAKAKAKAPFMKVGRLVRL